MKWWQKQEGLVGCTQKDKSVTKRQGKDKERKLSCGENL